MESLKANLWKFYWIAGLSAFVLYHSFDKVFMQTRGLSVTEIVFLEIAFSIIIIFLEVPSGALADRWSRKYVLAAHTIFFTINAILWAISQNFLFFLLGAVAGAIHMSLLSGTFTSLIYDTLKELRREPEYVKIYGRIGFYGGVSGLVAAILGSLIADRFGLAVPFWMTGIASLAALIFTLSLREPEIHRTTGELSYWEHIATTFRYISRHALLVPLVVIGVSFSATFFIMDEYMQLYFAAVGIPILFLGSLAALKQGIAALASKFAFLLKWIPRKQLYTLLLAASSLGFLGVGSSHSWLGIPFAFLPIAATFLSTTLLLADFHAELPSSQRATAESFFNLLKGVAFMPLALLFSYTADHSSIFSAFSIIGITLIAVLLVLTVSAAKKNFRQPSESAASNISTSRISPKP